jgi:hypothetical protein
MKTLRPFSLLLTLLLLNDIANAGGPLGAVGTTGRRYAASSFPLRYWVDQGSLGAFTNTTGVTITNYAFQQWASVRSAALSFTNAGYLSRDVTSATDPYISGSTQFSDGINPVIFDATGAITDAKLGTGAHNSVLGFAGSAYSGNTYVEGYAIINGALSGSGTSSDIDRYEAVLTHEIGHFLGVAHAQVSMHGDFCTMYPVIESTTQKVLQPDDTTAIANLYPTSGFLAATGSITGTVKSATGTNLSGVNVIAENSSTGATYSTIVDYYSGGKSGFDSPPAATGTYTFAGLRPGSYNIRIEPMNASFSGGSSVASYYSPINTTVPREWWDGSNESGDMLTDNVNEQSAVSVSAGSTRSGINFVSNASNTLVTLTYHNGTPYYIWSLPYGSIQKYALRCTTPAKGAPVEVQFTLDPRSVLPMNGSMTISVHANAAGSLSGVPGAVLGSVTIPYSELATDQINEVWLRQLGAAINFDSNQTFHVSFATNGVGSPVFYTDNGSPTQNRTSYQGTDGIWHNFPEGGWGAGYNLIASVIYTKSPTVQQPVVTAPITSLSQTSVDFGSVALHATADRTIRLTNTGTANLVVSGTSILGIDSLDYAIVTGGGAFTLAPSAFRDITLRFWPCMPSKIPGITRSAKFAIYSNAATSPNFVSLVGVGVEATPLAVVTPIKFGTVRPGLTYYVDTAIVYNVGSDTLRVSNSVIVSASGDSSAFRIMTPAGSVGVAPDSMFHLRLQFNPVDRHNYVGTLRILHDANLGMTEIPIYGNGAAGELGAPQSLTWTMTRANSDSAVTLHNIGNAALLIRGIAVTSWKDSAMGAFVQLSQPLPIALGIGDSLRIPLTFNPTAGIGDYYSTLQLLTDSYPDTLQTVELHINANALAVAEAATRQQALTIYPNPATTTATVSLGAVQRGATMDLIDVTGKTLSTTVLTDGSKATDLDTSMLTSGQYYIVVRNGKHVTQAKLQVRH